MAIPGDWERDVAPTAFSCHLWYVKSPGQKGKTALSDINLQFSVLRIHGPLSPKVCVREFIPAMVPVPLTRGGGSTPFTCVHTRLGAARCPFIAVPRAEMSLSEGLALLQMFFIEIFVFGWGKGLCTLMPSVPLCH